MRVELVPPESVIHPRHWVRHDQAFAMTLGPGSIEWGSKGRKEADSEAREADF
jgi:AraC family transcriptional regulator